MTATVCLSQLRTGALKLDLWEFVRASPSVREHWRWRRKDLTRNVVLESSPFLLFLSCFANAREHGFDVTAHEFRLVYERQDLPARTDKY